MPAAMPWTARKPISAAADMLAAQQADETTNSTRQPSHRRLPLQRMSAQLVMGTTAASASR